MSVSVYVYVCMRVGVLVCVQCTVPHLRDITLGNFGLFPAKKELGIVQKILHDLSALFCDFLLFFPDSFQKPLNLGCVFFIVRFFYIWQTSVGLG